MSERLTIKAVVAAALVVSGLSPAWLSETAHAAWKPNKPVKFVIMVEAGGDHDRLARAIQGIIEKNELSTVPFVAVNKGGDAGAEALRFLRERKGDGHVVMATVNSFYTTPLRNPDLGIDISEVTPIARVAEDTFQLWVHADSGIKNVNEYVAAAKRAGAAGWKMGGTRLGGDDYLVTALLKRAFGFNGVYTPFPHGSSVARQLVGSQINSSVNNPSEQVQFWQAGKSRPIATFSRNRLTIFPNVPTFRELGQDLVYTMPHSIVAPPLIDPEIQAYYIDVFSKVYNSKEWQSYLSKTGLRPAWLAGSELTKRFVVERDSHRRLLKALGEIL